MSDSCLPVRIFKRVACYLVLWTVAAVVCVTTLLQILLRVWRSPRKAFSWSKRKLPPAQYLDPALGRHECVNVNGIQLYYVASGSPDKPLMLMLHGFPECWYSWRYQMKYEQFREQYRVVAVDLRGFGRSSKPSFFPGAYHRDVVVEDVHQFIKALGYDSCVLVAHDWGGSIAFQLARMHPEYVDKLVVMDVPDDRVCQSFILANPSQLKKSLYMAFFQVPFVPELVMSMFDYGFINSAFRKHPMGVVNKDRMSDGDIEVFKWNASMYRTLRGGLNYYRNLPSLIAPIQMPARTPSKRYTMPTLILWGDSDAALDPNMATAHEDSGLFDDVTVRIIPQASHWVQQDQPDVVNQLMLTWLQSCGSSAD